MSYRRKGGSSRSRSPRLNSSASYRDISPTGFAPPGNGNYRRGSGALPPPAGNHDPMLNYSSYYRNRFGSHSPEEYLNLRLTDMSSRVTDGELRAVLEKEFRRYGEMHVRIIRTQDNYGPDRIAYVNFDRAGEARHARREALDRLRSIIGHRLKIDPAGVLKDQHGRWVGPPERGGGGPPSRGGAGGGIERVRYSRSPPPPMPRGGGGRNARMSDLGGGRYTPSPPLPPPPIRPSGGDRRSDKSSMGGGQKFRGGGDRPPPSDYRGNDFGPPAPERLAGGLAGGNRGTDDAPTRTLYVGNLSDVVTKSELESIFSVYGHIELLDIKAPTDSSMVGKRAGRPFAFIRYANPGVALAAKADQSGKFLHGLRMSMGYGKPIHSKRLWVGGLSNTEVSLDMIERELDRYGAIEKVDMINSGEATVLFSSLDAAVEACAGMREFCAEHKRWRDINVDFATEEDLVDAERAGAAGRAGSGGDVQQQNGQDRRRGERSPGGEEPRRSATRRGRSPERRRNGATSMNFERGGNGSTVGDYAHASKKARTSSSASATTRSSRRRRESSSRDRKTEAGGRKSGGSKADQNDPVSAENRSGSGCAAAEDRSNPIGGLKSAALSLGDLGITTMDTTESQISASLAKCSLPTLWSGLLVLKRSAYPVSLYHLKGNRDLLDSFFGGHLNLENGKTQANDGSACGKELVISQRLRLDQPKKDDIQRWLVSPDHAFLLAAPVKTALAIGSDAQTRSVKMLIKYFKEKQAAGVINLKSTTPAGAASGRTNPAVPETGMLYVFPACEFALTLAHALNENLHILTQQSVCADEVLLIVLIKGNA